MAHWLAEKPLDASLVRLARKLSFEMSGEGLIAQNSLQSHLREC